MTNTIWTFLDGVAVDADCELKNVHVYSSSDCCCEHDCNFDFDDCDCVCHFVGKVQYVAIMAKVDIVENKNSFYRMQLLESDDEKQ